MPGVTGSQCQSGCSPAAPSPWRRLRAAHLRTRSLGRSPGATRINDDESDLPIRAATATLPEAHTSGFLLSRSRGTIPDGTPDAEYMPPLEIIHAAITSSRSSSRQVIVDHPPGYRRSAAIRPHVFGALDSDPGTDVDYGFDSDDEMEVFPRSDDELITNGADLLYTVSDAVEFIGAGRMQYILLFAMALHSGMQGMDITYLTVLPSLAGCDFNLSSVQKALLSSVFFIGVTCGSFSVGFMGDRFGRNRALWIATAWTIYISYLSILSYNYTWLLIFRFLVGVGIGGFSLRNALMFEFLPTSFRVKSAFLILISWSAGTLVEMPILIIPGLGWKYLMAINHTPHFIVIAILLYLPESPRFLLKHGFHREAKECLRRMAEVNGARLPVGELVSEEEKDEAVRQGNVFANQEKRVKYHDSFFGLYQTKVLRTTTVMLNLIWFSLFFAEYGMYFFSTEMLKNLHRHDDGAPLEPPTTVINVTAEFLSNMSLSTAKTILATGFGVPMLNVTMSAATTAAADAMSLLGDGVQSFSVSPSPSAATLLMQNATDALLNGTAEVVGEACIPLTGSDYLSLFTTFMGSFPGIIIFFWIMDLVGRRTALALNSFAACAFIAGLMVPNLTRLSLTIILSCLRAVLTAAFKVLLVYTPEVYPTMIRSRGVGFNIALGRFGAVLTPFVAEVLLKKSMLAGEFVYLATCALAGALGLLLPIETKGKPLPE
ncbi:synaptic vesicle 2-related protein-like isoform X1 [Sycon ciliatum]|uniref:synaptic vesicle 2-related protein-like isoform X1 n=1 Tax=Sycon ciliatum TaxID=27933 RepID=UPI0031F60D59